MTDYSLMQRLGIQNQGTPLPSQGIPGINPLDLAALLGQLTGRAELRDKGLGMAMSIGSQAQNQIVHNQDRVDRDAMAMTQMVDRDNQRAQSLNDRLQAQQAMAAQRAEAASQAFDIRRQAGLSDYKTKQDLAAQARANDPTRQLAGNLAMSNIDAINKLKDAAETGDPQAQSTLYGMTKPGVVEDKRNHATAIAAEHAAQAAARSVKAAAAYEAALDGQARSNVLRSARWAPIGVPSIGSMPDMRREFDKAVNDEKVHLKLSGWKAPARSDNTLDDIEDTSSSDEVSDEEAVDQGGGPTKKVPFSPGQDNSVIITPPGGSISSPSPVTIDDIDKFITELSQTVPVGYNFKQLSDDAKMRIDAAHRELAIKRQSLPKDSPELSKVNDLQSKLEPYFHEWQHTISEDTSVPMAIGTVATGGLLGGVAGAANAIKGVAQAEIINTAATPVLENLPPAIATLTSLLLPIMAAYAGRRLMRVAPDGKTVQMSLDETLDSARVSVRQQLSKASPEVLEQLRVSARDKASSSPVGDPEHRAAIEALNAIEEELGARAPKPQEPEAPVDVQGTPTESNPITSALASPNIDQQAKINKNLAEIIAENGPGRIGPDAKITVLPIQDTVGPQVSKLVRMTYPGTKVTPDVRPSIADTGVQRLDKSIAGYQNELAGIRLKYPNPYDPERMQWEDIINTRIKSAQDMRNTLATSMAKLGATQEPTPPDLFPRTIPEQDSITQLPADDPLRVMIENTIEKQDFHNLDSLERVQYLLGEMRRVIEVHPSDPEAQDSIKHLKDLENEILNARYKAGQPENGPQPSLPPIRVVSVDDLGTQFDPNQRGGINSQQQAKVTQNLASQISANQRGSVSIPILDSIIKATDAKRREELLSRYHTIDPKQIDTRLTNESQAIRSAISRAIEADNDSRRMTVEEFVDKWVADHEAAGEDVDLTKFDTQQAITESYNVMTETPELSLDPTSPRFKEANALAIRIANRMNENFSKLREGSDEQLRSMREVAKLFKSTPSDESLYQPLAAEARSPIFGKVWLNLSDVNRVTPEIVGMMQDPLNKMREGVDATLTRLKEPLKNTPRTVDPEDWHSLHNIVQLELILADPNHPASIVGELRASDKPAFRAIMDETNRLDDEIRSRFSPEKQVEIINDVRSSPGVLGATNVADLMKNYAQKIYKTIHIDPVVERLRRELLPRYEGARREYAKAVLDSIEHGDSEPMALQLANTVAGNFARAVFAGNPFPAIMNTIYGAINSARVLPVVDTAVGAYKVVRQWKAVQKQLSDLGLSDPNEIMVGKVPLFSLALTGPKSRFGAFYDTGIPILSPFWLFEKSDMLTKGWAFMGAINEATKVAKQLVAEGKLKPSEQYDFVMANAIDHVRRVQQVSGKLGPSPWFRGPAGKLLGQFQRANVQDLNGQLRDTLGYTRQLTGSLADKVRGKPANFPTADQFGMDLTRMIKWALGAAIAYEVMDKLGFDIRKKLIPSYGTRASSPFMDTMNAIAQNYDDLADAIHSGGRTKAITNDLRDAAQGAGGYTGLPTVAARRWYDLLVPPGTERRYNLSILEDLGLIFHKKPDIFEPSLGQQIRRLMGGGYEKSATLQSEFRRLNQKGPADPEQMGRRAEQLIKEMYKLSPEGDKPKSEASKVMDEYNDAIEHPLPNKAKQTARIKDIENRYKAALEKERAGWAK